jgi:hypothetical protein
MLGLDNAVAMGPVGASGHQQHGVAKIDTVIITWQEGIEQYGACLVVYIRRTL